MWKVVKRGVKLSDAWYDYGAKSFSYSDREAKKEQFEVAKRWASKKFGIKTWLRDPFGSFGEASFVMRRTAELLKKFEASRIRNTSE